MTISKPSVERLGFVLPVDDMSEAVTFLADLLGTQPTFVDGDRWAQFDLGAVRLSLSGTDRVANAPGIMVKVGDLDEACAALAAVGKSAGPIAVGAHERRSVVNGPGGWPVVLYSALPPLKPSAG